MTRSTGVGCPHLDGFDPLDPDHLANPQKVWAEARRSNPVFYMPEIDYWAITRYDDIAWVIRDTETFSSDVAIDQGTVPPEFADRLPLGYPQMWPTLLNNDPPSHTRIRKLSQRALTPRSVAAREPEIRAIAEDLISNFEQDGKADIMSSFAIPFPLQVISRVLGLETVDYLQIKAWSDESMYLVNPTLSREERLELTQTAGVDFYEFIEQQIEGRRNDPRDDLISELVQAEVDGEAVLTNREIISVVAQLIIGGNETTTNLIGNMLLLLDAHPETLEEVRENPELAADVVEETLRMKSSIKAIKRTTTRDVEVSGVTIPAGSRVLVTYGAGNQDPGAFDHADQFDIHRPGNAKHLGFGKGIHFCIGAPLARGNHPAAQAQA